MIGVAVFLTAGGLLVGYMERRKNRSGRGSSLLLGLPAVYICFLASASDWKWLYIPGLMLLAASYLLRFVAWRVSNATGDEEHHGGLTTRDRR
jgi:hypothetical protein